PILQGGEDVKNETRISALAALRGAEYRCPACRGLLILKKGRRVVHHFAHKPPTNCTWAKGETQAHLRAKTELAQSFTGRGIRAEVEFVVETLTGDRRADVMAWKPNGFQVAFELQHTPISVNEIEARAFSYA
ncbi:competence protein CoiA, partial [Roseibium sp. RKSG952]|uniref:competence protein CoiA n=1 Tax=Roseibium sp. RKSG952 TaxID=2529384 RepID=UPI0013C7BB5B